MADGVAMAMLAMSETLRTQQPPKLKMAIKCAKGALKLHLSNEAQAHCNLQLGKLLFFYTDHYELARSHLETAYHMMQGMGDVYLAQRLEALSLIAELYIHYASLHPENHWPLTKFINDLRLELPVSIHFPDYCNKLLFYFIEANILDGNASLAFDGCNKAIEAAQDKAMELYFRITKNVVSCRLLGVELDRDEINATGAMIAEFETADQNSPHLSNIKFYYMCTKLAHLLSDGQMRSSRGYLRKIQTEVGRNKESQSVEGIRWMDAMPMTIFACLMTIVNSLVQCNYDRALKYFTVAIKHADDVITKYARTPPDYGVVRCVNRMRMSLLEAMALCNVMACKPSYALNNVQEMIHYSYRYSSFDLFVEFAPNVQVIFGLIDCYLREFDSAERHYKAALKYRNAREKNMNVMINVNLALLYLNQCKLSEYYDVAESFSAPRIANCSLLVKSNVRFLMAIQFFLQNKNTDCKITLSEMLETAKAEDLFRLHGLGILLLSNLVPVFEDVIKPTVDWSKKGYDQVVIFWSNIVLSKLLEARNLDMADYQEEARRSFAALQTDQLRAEIKSSPYLALTEWFDGEPVAFLPKEDA